MTQAAAGGQDLRLLAVPGSSIADQGQPLLVLTGRDRQCAAELSAASGQNLTATVHALGRFVDQSFLLIDDENGTRGYRLGSGRDRPVTADRRARILLVEDDLLIRDLLIDVLETEGYAIVACETPSEATLLLQQASFDLIITDGFSPVPGGVIASTADLVRSADLTPVVLFSAHLINVMAAVAAGFRDVITKPFDLDRLIGQVARCVEGSLHPTSEDQYVELRS